MDLILPTHITYMNNINWFRMQASISRKRISKMQSTIMNKNLEDIHALHNNRISILKLSKDVLHNKKIASSN